MKITNKYNLPDRIVRAIGESYAPTVGRVAVTSLVDSPLVRYLKIKFWDSLEEDVSDKFWALDGQADHFVIQRGCGKGDLVELPLEVNLNGLVVSGRPDIVTPDLTLIDIKRSSVYSFMFEKASWSQQLNIYNYLYFVRFGKVLQKAEIWGRLRDWTKSKTYHDHDYPEIPFLIQPIELWPLITTTEYVAKRVELHKQADDVLMSNIGGLNGVPLCTDADRWLKPTTYAVMKKGVKKAMRVLSTPEEAAQWKEEHAKAGNTLTVEKRPGGYTRCEQFCVCRPVCPVYPKGEILPGRDTE